MDSTALAAGSLRNRIVLQQASATRAADGSEVKTWNDLMTVSAMIDTQGGREFYQAKAVNAELTHEITIRYQTGLAPAMRVKFTDPKENTDRYFDIRSILNPDNQKRRVLLLHVRELVGRQIQS